MHDTARQTRHRVRCCFMALGEALLVLPWLFMWLLPIAALFEFPVAWATLVLALAGTAFVWSNVVKPLRSRPRLVALHRLRPWRQYAGWLTFAVAAEVILILATLIVHEQLAEWQFLPRVPKSPEVVPPHFFTHPLGPIAMVLAAVGLSPLAEEFAFRGRMQIQLERALGIVPAIMIPAGVFSLLHGVTIAPHHLPFALFVGWVVWRTGSIWPAVYMHALNNAAALAMYFTPDWVIFSENPPSWLWPYALTVGVVSLCVLFAAGARIHRIAQRSRPHAGGWPRRSSSARSVTLVLPG
jgi:membrane protease YdiL (CAAX protease family)